MVDVGSPLDRECRRRASTRRKQLKEPDVMESTERIADRQVVQRQLTGAKQGEAWDLNGACIDRKTASASIVAAASGF